MAPLLSVKIARRAELAFADCLAPPIVRRNKGRLSCSNRKTQLERFRPSLPVVATERADNAVLAARGLLRWLLGALDCDVIELMGGEQARDLLRTACHTPLRVRPGGGTQAHAQAHRGGLHDLGQLDPRNLVNLQRQRRDRNPPAILFGEREHVGGAALDANRGQRVATRAGFGTHHDAVAEVVAQNGWTWLARLLTRTVCDPRCRKSS